MEKKRTAWFFFQIILSSPYFWSAVAAALLIIWTWLGGWFVSFWAPLTIPIILITAALTFYIVNQIKEHRRYGQIKYQPLIMKWLLDFGYLIKQVPETDDKIAWEIEATSQPDNVTVKVAAFKQTPTLLTLGVVGLLNAPEQEDLARYTSPPNSTLIEELQIEMNRLGIEYTDISHPLKGVQLVHNIPLDDPLTQAHFLNELMQMRHVFVLFANVVKKYKKLNPIKS